MNPGREVLHGSADVEAFAGWHEDYRARLRQGDWIDLPAAASRLVTLLRAGEAVAPEVLRLVGFDRVAPQLASLLVEPDGSLRLAAILALASIGGENALSLGADE